MYYNKPIIPAYWRDFRFLVGLCQISFHVTKTWPRWYTFTERYRKRALWRTGQMFNYLGYSSSSPGPKHLWYPKAVHILKPPTVFRPQICLSSFSIRFSIDFSSMAPFAVPYFYCLPSLSGMQNALNVNSMGFEDSLILCNTLLGRFLMQTTHRPLLCHNQPNRWFWLE